MSKISFLCYENKKVELNERNLILTGKNGSGKTRFLRQLEDNLINNRNSKYQDIERANLLKDIKYGLDNFSKSLNIKNADIKNFDDLKNTNLNEDQFRLKINQFYLTLYQKYEIFQKNTQDYIINTSEDLKKSHRGEINPNKISEEYYYYNNPEYILDFINRLTISINQYDKLSQLFKISPNNFSKDEIFVFDSSRVKNDRLIMKVFKEYEDYQLDKNRENLEEALEAYLISKKSQLIKFSEKQSNLGSLNLKIVKLFEWFTKVEEDLKFILENPNISISFNHQSDQVFLVDKVTNSVFTFDSLSSGFKAIFKIYASLLMEAQLKNIKPIDLTGIAIIDEIDVHLHISLQKKVLPFLIKAFPKVQFIVSTHSPFVITSTGKDTVVFDISSREFFEDDLSRYSYESVIKGLFHVEVQSEQLVSEIKVVAEILNSEPNNYEKLRSVLRKITPFVKQLDVESKSFYFRALNHLLDNQELGDLDV
jgi:predicted ATP-binding protein involved in virulence